MKHSALARGLMAAAKLCLVVAAVGLSWRCGSGGVTPSGGAGGFSERRVADSLRAGRTAILLGAGNLGMALVKHLSFEAKGFRLIGIFDKNPRLIGQKIHGVEILPESALESFCREHKPDAAILCLPKEVVEELGDRLVSYGIRGFWNFSHYDIGLRHRDKGNPIVVENVHLGDSLMTLCYQVNELDED